jgi:hypothetical protein
MRINKQTFFLITIYLIKIILQRLIFKILSFTLLGKGMREEEFIRKSNVQETTNIETDVSG